VGLIWFAYGALYGFVLENPMKKNNVFSGLRKTGCYSVGLCSAFVAEL
jgi:hypothetical protein